MWVSWPVRRTWPLRGTQLLGLGGAVGIISSCSHLHWGPQGGCSLDSPWELVNHREPGKVKLVTQEGPWFTNGSRLASESRQLMRGRKAPSGPG